MEWDSIIYCQGKKAFLRHVFLYGSSSTWNAMRENGFPANSKTSFMNSGDQPFLTLKIPATSFSRFLWWMFIQPYFISNYHSWDSDLKSLQTIFRAITRWWWRWWSWWIVFVVWLTDERRSALFPAGTIVRDPDHSEAPTRREQGLSLRRAWAQT